MAGTIFISYRRGEDTPSAGWLRSLLIENGVFKPEQVFLDVDGIDPGEDFVTIIEEQVAACDVLLCMLGRGWFDAIDRLGRSQDYVRIEIAAAITQGKKVIPLLINQAQMPKPDVLPEELRPLIRRQAAWLRHDHFKADTQRLISVLKKALAAKAAATQAQAMPQHRRSLLASESPKQTAAAETSSVASAYRDVDAPWCPEMVVIPQGSFMMGSPATEAGRGSDEGPQRRVTIAYSFAIGKFPVTFDEFDCFCEETRQDKPGDEGAGRGRRPVINVSWTDAQAYCGWLSKITGRRYRLPSEAEWEYACRAGTTTRYSFGDDISAENALFAPGILSGLMRAFQSPKTTDVGGYRPNPWGVCDMHGNVWEWVEDVYHGTYDGAPADGSAWTQSSKEEEGKPRVLRGGSWLDSQVFARSAYRVRRGPFFRFYNIGFRVVCSSPSSGH